MFEERLLLAGGEILETRISGADFFLALRKGDRILAECKNGKAFKSVEQLRYDFQRDVEDALRQD